MTLLQDPLSAAQTLRATIQGARKETEETRRLAPQVVKGLIATGLCRLAVPATLGGHETEPVVALKVYEELAAAEASVAWIAWNNALPCLFSCHLADSVRAELFSDATILFANSTRPSGRALAVEGGFRVSGQWALVSGCELADWIPLMCVVTEGTESNRQASSGAPEMRMAYLPKGSYRILDTWHVGGLRGTGSHDMVVEDIFVPTERTFSFMDPKLLNRPLYRMPLGATLAAGGAAICLGIAQTAIDTLLDLAVSKGQVDAGSGLRDRAAIQMMVAEAGAAIDASRLLLHAAIDDLWTTCNQEMPVTDRQRVRMWAGAFHAAKVAKEVVTAMYEAAGASALYVDCPLERAHRDIHAARQHVILGPKWLEEAGRVQLGLKATNPLF